MKKIKKTLLMLALMLLMIPTLAQSQQIENEMNKISLKLRMDKTYLNLNYLLTSLDTSVVRKLQNIPRTNSRKPYSFSSDKSFQYRIVFLNKGVDLDSIYLMYVDEIKLNTLVGKSFFVDESVKDDTTEVLSFNDLYTLKLKKSKQYEVLYDLIKRYVDENEGEILPTLLGINPDNREKSYMGMTSKDNTDYFNFQKTNNPHYIPSEKKKKVRVRRSGALGKEYRIDASFTRLTFSLKSLDYSIGSTGFELTTVEPILNLLPFESANIFLGFRSIFRISNEKKLKKASFIDAKLMGRINTKNNSIFESQPFVMGNEAKLNLNSGFGGELNFTRVFGLPFFSIKGYISGTNFENPTYSKLVNDSTKQAYFSSSQVEATFSFYWNGNTQMTSRFRFDFGVAYFNTWKVLYNRTNEILNPDDESLSNIVPVFGLYYTFAPASSPLLGMNLRVFDTRLSVGGWIKIFEFEPDNLLRLEAFSITEPLTRSLQEWESSGGLFFQIRYRYGL